MKPILICVLSFGLFWGTPSGATEILGTSLVDGRKVELLSDGTWRFAEPLPETCQVISSRLMLCAEDSKWTNVTPANADIAAQFRFNDRTYAVIVDEDVGSNQGITAASMRETVLDNAAATVGYDRDQVLVIGVETTSFLDQTAETITYFFEIDGIPVVYRNTILVRANTTVQALTYELSNELTGFHSDLHRAFLSEIVTRD